MKYPNVSVKIILLWGLLFFYCYIIISHFLANYKEGATDMQSASEDKPMDASGNKVAVMDASNNTVAPTDASAAQITEKKVKVIQLQNEIDEIKKQIGKMQGGK